MKPTPIIDCEQLQTKVITFLRFPLIICVVLIHTQINSINGIEGDLKVPNPFNGTFPLYESVLYICAQILTRIAVPIFFLFSGFLFYYKINGYTTKTYVYKLKSRVQTLLIPYIFWNFLFIVIYNIGGMLFSGFTKSIIGEGYTVKDWLMTLWNYNNSECPVSYQFWFLRDLMVVVLFSPAIYWLTKKLDYIYPLILCILWITGLWFNVVGFSIDAFFFFSLGAYFSIKNKNFAKKVKSHTLLLSIIYFIFIIITFYSRSYDYVVYVRRVCVLFGMAFTIALTTVFIKKRNFRLNTFLSNSSFFIYAYHIIVLPLIRRVLLFIIPCTTEVRATILYFLWSITTIVVGLILYLFLRKWLPKTTAFITGGR